MRKHLFTALTSAILLVVLLTSCMSSTTTTSRHPVLGGMIIYSSVDLQAIVARDPLYIAFKFNSLLATVAKQKDDNPSADITIENVMVNVRVNVEKNYLKHLFGGATIKEESPGIWKIVFTKDQTGEQDTDRSGYIIIDTKEKMLADLTQGTEKWEISTGEGADAYHLYFGERETFQATFENYTITRDLMPGVWSIKGKSTASTVNALEENLPANWNTLFMLTQKGGTGSSSTLEVFQDYDNAIVADYLLTTVASGKPAYNDFEQSYTTEGLMFQPKCGRLPFAGTETVTLKSMGNLDPEVFPENRVRLVWKKHKDCVAYYELSYAGETWSSLNK